MPTPSATRTGRARPLKPDDRRAALVAATLPLLLEHGPGVSTRAIAEAAGVAEGTLFRVFPSKEALVHATIASALDEQPLLAELAAVDRTRQLRLRVGAADLRERARELRQRLVTITELLQRRHAGLVRLMMAVGPQMRPPAPSEDRARPPERHHHRGEAVTAAVAALLEPDAALLRVPPHDLAQLLRQLTFAGAHPGFAEADPLAAPEVVAVLLDGVLSRPSPSDVREDAPC